MRKALKIANVVLKVAKFVATHAYSGNVNSFSTGVNEDGKVYWKEISKKKILQ